MKKYLLKYSLEFLVIVMGISISFLIEKRNAKDYQEELKNQSLKRIIKNIEVDIIDLKYNINVNTIASNATDWLVKNNDNYSNFSKDSIGIYLNNAILSNTVFVDNQEEYRALQNSGLIELIENEKAVTALQNKYIYHEFYKKIEDVILKEAFFLSDFIYENTLLKSQILNENGLIYDRVYLRKNKIPHKVLERLKTKGFYHSFYADKIKSRITNDSLLIEYLKTETNPN
jgi:phosphopantetheine adenylyltransferase